MADNGGKPFVAFAQRVGIVCGAAISVGVIIQWFSGFLWGNATRPIVEELRRNSERIAQESVARQQADSLMVEQIANLAKYMVAPRGSDSERDAVRDVIEAPADLEKQATPNRPRRP